MRVCLNVCLSVCVSLRAGARRQFPLFFSSSSFFFFFFFFFLSRKNCSLRCPSYYVMTVIPVYKCRGDTELLSVYWHKPREGSTRVDSPPSPGSVRVGSIDLLSVG